MPRSRLGIALCLWAGALACAPTLAPPAPDRAGVLGVVELVPREGIPAPGAHAGAYGDRRLRDVRLVDYSTPGFSVVYLDTGEAPGGVARLAVVAGLTEPHLTPRLVATGAGGTVQIDNRSPVPATVSVPRLSRIETIPPGGSVVLALPEPGEVEAFLLGGGDSAVVWASPGPWTRPDADGRFALGDLPPGRHRLRAWRPRFPSAETQVELLPGQILRDVRIEIGVGLGESHDAD